MSYGGIAWFSVVTGAVVLVVGSVGYSELRELADWMARDGSADSVTPDVIVDVAPRLRLIGAAYLTIGAGLLLVRRSVQCLFAQERASQSSATSANYSGPGAVKLTRNDWIWWGVLLLILAMALVIRVPHLGATMSHDGAFSYVNYSSFGPAVIATKYPNPNNHMLHTHLTYISQLIAGGASEVVLRLPALIAGLGLVTATGAFARRIAGTGMKDAAGWLAAALIAASVVWIQYSVMSRGYTLLALLCVLWAWATLQVVRHDSKRCWTLFILIGVLAYYTMPSVLFLHFGVFLYLMWAAGPASRLKVLVANVFVSLGAVALYLPALATMSLSEMRTSHDGATWGRMETRPFPEFVAQNAQVWDEALAIMLRDQAVPVLALAFVGLVVFLWILMRRHHRDYGLLLAALIIGALSILLLLRNVPLLRTWYMFLPLLTVAAALGMARLLTSLPVRYSRTLAGILALAIAVSPLLFDNRVQARQSPKRHPIFDAHQVGAFLAPHVSNGVTVWMENSPLPVVQYYLLRADVNIGDQVRILDTTSSLSGDLIVCSRSGRHCETMIDSYQLVSVYESSYTMIYRLQ